MTAPANALATATAIAILILIGPSVLDCTGRETDRDNSPGKKEQETSELS
jgi:hypothetical protein